MANIVELLYDVLFHPCAAFRAIVDGERLRSSLVVFVLTVLVTTLVAVFQLKQHNLFVMAGLIAFAQIGGGILCWIMQTALYHVVAVLAGGRGCVKNLLACFGFCRFPMVFSAPLWLLFVVLFSHHQLIHMLMSCLLGLWVFVLHIQAIRVNYDLSIERSLLVVVVPAVVVAGGILIGAVIFGVTITGVVMQWMGQ